VFEGKLRLLQIVGSRVFFECSFYLDSGLAVLACGMVEAKNLVGEEWAEWYQLTPVQRWLESQKLWQVYLALGGSLDPEPDTQSPFFDARAPRPRPAHGQTVLRIIRRSRV